MNTSDSNLIGAHGPLGPPLGGMAVGGDRDEDVLYQKDASFSAELATGPGAAPVPAPPLPPAPAVSFVGDAAAPQPHPQPPAAASSAAPTTPTPTTLAPCTLDCGSGGTCVQPAEGAPPTQRCQCPLGRGGPRCETELEHPDGAKESALKQQQLVAALAGSDSRASRAGRLSGRRAVGRDTELDLLRMEPAPPQPPPAGADGWRPARPSSSGTSAASAYGHAVSRQQLNAPRRPRHHPMVQCIRECCSALTCYLVLVLAGVLAIVLS